MKSTSVNYRQKYKDYFGIDFDDDMVVHHIDFDRNNNDISNLVLIPRKLHGKYHLAYYQLFCSTESGFDKRLMLNEENSPWQYGQWMRIMAELIDDLKPWIRMKEINYLNLREKQNG